LDTLGYEFAERGKIIVTSRAKWCESRSAAVKILLINSPVRLDAEPNCIPYGLATIASTLINSGFDVEIYDVNALRAKKSGISLGYRA
jgi:hypothetical protein